MDITDSKSGYTIVMENVKPYAEGEWKKLITGPISVSSRSFSSRSDVSKVDENEQSKSNDLILRGPVWNYGYKKCCYSHLLFGQSRRTLLTHEEKIVKGNDWVPAKPITCSFAKYLLRKLKRANPEAVALQETETGRFLKYKELIEKVKSLASGLRWIGISPSQVVALVSYNSLEAILMMLANFMVGSIPAIVDPSLNPVDIGTLFRIASPRLIFTECGKTLAKVEMAVSYSVSSRMPRIVVNNYRNQEFDTERSHLCFKDLLVEVEENFKPTYVLPNPQNPIMILFTSGSTGTPKGAVIPERFFLSSKMFVESSFQVSHLSYTSLLTAPLTWVSTVSDLLIHLVAGHCLVFFRGPTSEGVLISALQKYKIMLWLAGPSILWSLLRWPVKPRCDSLKVVIVTGVPFSAENVIRVNDDLFEGKVQILQAYGLTESGILTANSVLANKFGSVGKVYFNTKMKVVDIQSGLALGPCEEGELCFKSNSLFLGYHNTQLECFDDEGYFHTGDMGFYDEQEFVFITSRIKDLIKWKSYQVAPAEVEAEVLKHHTVKECAVVGIPDGSGNELITAAVVFNDGYEFTDLNTLAQVVNKQLSENKKIRGGIHVFKMFPKTPSGKPIKSLIKKEVLDRETTKFSEETTN